MKTVANSTALNDAIAQMSDRAWRLLRDVHAGRRHDGRDAATVLLRDLTEVARCSGADLSDVPAYRANATNWHAIARLAGEARLAGASIAEQALQAG